MSVSKRDVITVGVQLSLVSYPRITNHVPIAISPTVSHTHRSITSKRIRKNRVSVG